MPAPTEAPTPRAATTPAPVAAAARDAASAAAAAGIALTPTPTSSAAVEACPNLSHTGTFSKSATARMGSNTASSRAFRRRARSFSAASAKSFASGDAASPAYSAAGERMLFPNTSPLTYLLQTLCTPVPSVHRSLT